MKSLLQIIGGFSLVVIGIIGLILPVMPGWIFLIPGLMVLSQHFGWAKRLVEWAKAKAEGVRKRSTRDLADQEPDQNQAHRNP